MTKKKMLLMGDEAIAQGAMDAGASGFYAYPGTPSTEIMEFVQHSKFAAPGIFTEHGLQMKRQPLKVLSA